MKREQFEQACRDHAEEAGHEDMGDLTRDGEGYLDTHTQAAWWGWQEASGRQGRGEPFGWLLITGHGTQFAKIKPKCEIDYWKPVYLHPPAANPAVKEFLTVAEPVKVPRDADLLLLWEEVAGGPKNNRIAFARALLATYGQPAQLAASAEPFCWTVLGVTYPRNWTYFGQDAEQGAKMNARSLGDERRAVPLYTAPAAAQPSVPLSMGLRAVATELLACFRAWEPGVRVLGNVQAKDGADLMQAILATPPAADHAQQEPK